jgi:hypothetical protein
MPQASGLYQSPLLSQIAVDFKNRDYIADKILTPVSVPKMLGQYLVWDQGVTFKIPKTEMAQNGQANMLEVKATKTPFSLTTHAQQAVIDELEIDQAPEAQIQAMKTSKLANVLLLQREIAVAAALTTGASFGSQTDALAGDECWDHADALPINQIMTAADLLPQRPNTLVLGRPAWSALRTNAQILDALRGVAAPGTATIEQVQRLFELDRILVGDAFKDTAGEGLAATKASIWGDNALLCYVDPSPPSPLMDQPTLGYLPTYGGGSVPTMRTFSWVDQNYGTGSGVRRIKVETAYSVLLSAPSMGFLFTNCVT